MRQKIGDRNSIKKLFFGGVFQKTFYFKKFFEKQSIEYLLSVLE